MAIFISHRGESCDAPENTVSAFKLAAKRKTDGIECDIYLTPDRHVVCCHDENAYRTSKHDALVTQTLFDTLRSWDFSNGKKAYLGERIPTLAETLACLKGDMQIYIEIKKGDVKMVPEMLKVIDASGVRLEQITMICFGQDVCLECKRMRPALKTLWLTDTRLTAKQLVAELRKCKADGVDHACFDYVDKEFVSTVKKAGFYFAVWTVDDAAMAKRFIDAGVDSITSNRAYAVMRELGLK
ncbi:MAG: hypothetical protein J5833_02700 [Victivallales bacterium]|nr:hypothetical protein [Victivallales bacterium]